MEKEYSDYVVQRVNELYHDLIGKKYDDSHPEIFKRLPPRWQRIAPIFFSKKGPLTILDLGTGTGFVPLMVAPHLKKEDVFICSDISSTILNVAQENIKSLKFENKFKYVKIGAQETYTLPFKDNAVDAITVNSMLHHVKNTHHFLSEINRVLRPGGTIIIAHEPNANFHTHLLLKNQARAWQLFLCPRQTMTRIARKIKVLPILEYLYYRITKPTVNNKEIAEEVSQRLMKEGVLTEPIAAREIKKITDIQIRGFIPEELLTTYQLSLLETYNHLSDDIAKKYNNRFILAYEKFLERLYPTYGNQFFMVKRKPENEDQSNHE
ncbi:class I SAM-dependent methyltransferase [Candidatus Woesearchaeota archaeon]|nr:class I SAM-dependent methyltransferase [Candidatus Woesearchaeota archaeon]